MPYRALESTSTAPTPPTPLSARYQPRSRRSTLLLALLPVFFIFAAAIAYVASAITEETPSNLRAWLVFAIIGNSAWIVIRRMRVRRGLAELNQSATLARHGSQAATIELCERLLDRYSGYGHLQAVVLNNLSIAIYQSGDLERARAITYAIEASGWMVRRTALRPLVMQNRGLYLALLGETESAAECALEARRWMTPATAAVSLFMLDVFVAARKGDFRQVLTLSGAADASVKLQLRSLRLVRAYALAESTPPSDARDEEIRVLVDGAKPVAPGELYYLVAHWPELERFLSTRGFGAALARA